VETGRRGSDCCCVRARSPARVSVLCLLAAGLRQRLGKAPAPRFAVSRKKKLCLNAFETIKGASSSFVVCVYLHETRTTSALEIARNDRVSRENGAALFEEKR
jgi:hypothetical protein